MIFSLETAKKWIETFNLSSKRYSLNESSKTLVIYFAEWSPERISSFCNRFENLSITTFSGSCPLVERPRSNADYSYGKKTMIAWS